YEILLLEKDEFRKSGEDKDSALTLLKISFNGSSKEEIGHRDIDPLEKGWDLAAASLHLSGRFGPRPFDPINHLTLTNSRPARSHRKPPSVTPIHPTFVEISSLSSHLQIFISRRKMPREKDKFWEYANDEGGEKLC
ncbi:hypothetical protein AKJ16_DCAP25432, partial [Drosera capensis]